MSKLGDLFPDELQSEIPTPAPASKQRAGIPISAPAGGKATPPSARSVTPSLASVSTVSKKVERVYVKDFVAGQDIESVYLVVEATLRAAKTGSKYVQATFCDKTGTIPVRQWDANEHDFLSYKINGYVKVRGRVETYKGAMQMIAFSVQDYPVTEINPADFLPVSTRPFDEMEKELDALLATFTDPDYKRLLDSIFSDPGTRSKFVRGPAATSVHHAWVGGLLEHVLSASKTAQSIAEQRPFLNRDLLLAGVILHDIGKIEELDGGPGFTYTDTGKLCGHIVLGALLVERHLLQLKDFPKKKRDVILHMILSHHGELEYGSPIKPYTAEAVALHHLECLDAKVQGIQSIIERENSSGNESAWTDFARVVDGRIYKG